MILADLATKTVSGKPPPTGFLITLWALAIFFVCVTVALIYFGFRDQRAVRDRRIADPAARAGGPAARAGGPDTGIDPTGRAGRAGCLLVTAVPCAILAFFFVGWLIGIS